MLASGPRERAPRIAAATTCLPHVASGHGELRGRGTAGVCGVGALRLGHLMFPLFSSWLGSLLHAGGYGHALK